MDLPKAFENCTPSDIVRKINHYGIRGVTNDWFKSYLSNGSQYLSINRYHSGIAAISCGVP